MRTICIIPARGGSKGLPRKNVLPVGGTPLIGRAIEAAKGSGRIDGVYVSTDDAEIAGVAQASGAGIIDRPAEISGSMASSEAALLHGLDVLAEQGIAPEVLVFLQCTSPFTSSDEIRRCVEALDDPEVHSALAVTHHHSFLWTLDADGYAVGVNHVWNEQRKLRQELPPQFLETGSIYVMRVAAFREKRTRFCGRVKPVVVERYCTEIDSPIDMALAQAVAPVVAAAHLQERDPRPIRALVMDFDGVHTDDRVVVAQDGTESVVCSRSDGMGIEMLRKAGLALLILSKERNPVVEARGRKLKVEVRGGIDEKLGELKSWAAVAGLDLAEIAYIGNDINDLACLQAVGLPVAPADANPAILPAARLVTKAGGGRGALRELAEILLARAAL